MKAHALDEAGITPIDLTKSEEIKVHNRCKNTLTHSFHAVSP